MTTNLVVGGEFEGASISGNRTIITSPPGIGSQWSVLPSSSGFDIHAEGFRASATGADGNNTGQYLEIRGDDANAIITWTINIPSNIITGSTATFNFDGSSRVGNSQATLTSGVYRIQVSGSNTFDSGTINVNNPSGGGWATYTENFTVSPGDTVTATWQETGGDGNSNTGRARGLRIDEVELLAQVASTVPEPATLGVFILSFLMLTSSRKRQFAQLS
ncbi:MAG: PEP-CTERM sorting domain-containing protein [Verrucomicrobiota bacterium]